MSPDTDDASGAQYSAPHAQRHLPLDIPPLLAQPWFAELVEASRTGRAPDRACTAAVDQAVTSFYRARARCVADSERRTSVDDDSAATVHALLRHERASIDGLRRRPPTRATAWAFVLRTGPLWRWRHSTRRLATLAAAHEDEVERWLAPRIAPGSVVVLDLAAVEARGSWRELY